MLANNDRLVAAGGFGTPSFVVGAGGTVSLSKSLSVLTDGTLSEGDWQVTSVASSQGEASPASVEALARVTAVLLKAANEGAPSGEGTTTTEGN